MSGHVTASNIAITKGRWLLLTCVLSACASRATQVQSLPAAAPQAGSISSASPSPTNAALPIATQESALAPETNPLGDIPDNQAFVSYASSSGGYSIDVPEGWARTENGSDVRFADKFDGLSISIRPAGSAPTLESVRQNEILWLRSSERAFQLGQIATVNLPAGPGVKITAAINSEPDSVTGKQVRLEEDIYLLFHNGSEAIVQLWAPQGADNVDQWKSISESFKWQ